MIERVGKTLRLEEEQGHRDRAAAGGIAHFAAEQLRPLGGRLPTRDADDRLARVQALLRGYAELDLADRRQRVSSALEELRALYRLVRDLGDNDPASPGYGRLNEHLVRRQGRRARPRQPPGKRPTARPRSARARPPLRQRHLCRLPNSDCHLRRR